MWAEREVRKANRELQNQTAKMMDMQKIEFLTKRCSDLFMEMKRNERESIKNKKRTDQLQKDKDNSRQELNKTVSLKEKLEKLCRELQKENNKLKVLSHDSTDGMGKKQDADEFYVGRTRTKLLPMRKFGARQRGTSGIQAFCVEWMNIKKTKITHVSRWWIWRSRSCAFCPCCFWFGWKTMLTVVKILSALQITYRPI